MQRSNFFLAVAGLLCLTVGALAADKNPAFTDPAKAGPDFAFQGEYLSAEGGERWGSQVIALGDGKFDVIGYKGGLPGDGWKRGDETKPGKGELKDGVVTASGEGWKATIKDGVIAVTDPDGNKIVDLKKTERKSPTLGAKPPQGAKVLFDGTTPDNFENGKIIEDNLLAASNPTSKAKFQDHTLHIEFRTPFMPLSRGQARGNSGVYMQGRYELQVLDSFGLDGATDECGGIYKISKPIVNACLPPLSWQTYDIDFTAAKYDGGKKVKNARCTIKHNGIVIHDDLELPNETPGKDKEGPEANSLFLQDHGNPVAFRNIWVVEKK
jgi:hypothetical protein